MIQRRDVALDSHPTGEQPTMWRVARFPVLVFITALMLLACGEAQNQAANSEDQTSSLPDPTTPIAETSGGTDSTNAADSQRAAPSETVMLGDLPQSGEPVVMRGTIETPSDQHTFRLNFQEAGAVWMETTTCDLSQRGVLLADIADSDDRSRWVAADATDGCQLIGVIEIPSPGERIVTIKPADFEPGSTGTYEVNITYIQQHEIQPIESGSVNTVDLATPGELYRYAFEYSRGQKAVLTFSECEISPSGGTILLGLIPQDGLEIALNLDLGPISYADLALGNIDDSCNPAKTFELDWPDLEPGAFVLNIYGRNEAVGSLSFEFDVVPS